MGYQLIEHPRTARMMSFTLVIIGAALFIRIVQLDGKVAHIIAEHKSDMARAASEALGG